MKRAAGSSQGTSSTRPAKKAKYIKRKRSKKGKGTPEMYTKAQVFPDVMNTTLRYNSNMVAVDVAAASTYYSFALNGMFDFDFDNVLGNKQPLYFDELVTNDGPYKNYKVGSWKTKIEIINDSTDPLLVYWAQGSAVTEMDTLVEVQNRPNVRELILTQRDGDKNHGTIIAPGSVKEVYGSIRNPGDLTGATASNPTVTVWGTLFFYNPGGIVATPVNAWVKITHDFHTEMSTADAIIS